MLPARTLFAAVLLATGTTATQAADYKIDETHSLLQFRTQHLGYSWLYGRFNITGGTLRYDPAKPEASRVQVDVDVVSIDTNHELRDEHLRVPRFGELADRAIAARADQADDFLF